MLLKCSIPAEAERAKWSNSGKVIRVAFLLRYVLRDPKIMNSVTSAMRDCPISHTPKKRSTLG
jgi:hypothetical protein